MGDEKADDGRLPFNILGAITAGAMISSEVRFSLIKSIQFDFVKM